MCVRLVHIRHTSMSRSRTKHTHRQSHADVSETWSERRWKETWWALAHKTTPKQKHEIQQKSNSNSHFSKLFAYQKLKTIALRNIQKLNCRKWFLNRIEYFYLTILTCVHRKRELRSIEWGFFFYTFWVNNVATEIVLSSRLATRR